MECGANAFVMPSGEPTFSVVIPVRDGEKYIGLAVESVLRQTYPHFHIFVLENGSKDRTTAIVQSYDDERIQLFPASRDLGIEENWARIVDLDLAEYVTVLSHDDLFYPHFLEEIVHLVTTYPDASLYLPHFDLIDDAGNTTRPCYPMPAREDGDSFLHNLHALRRDSYATGYVMRSADYRRIGGMPALPDLMFADHLLAYRLSVLSYKACSPRSSFAYREHGQSISHVVKLDRIYGAAKQYLEALEESGHLSHPEYRRAAFQYVSFIFNAHYHKILVTLIASDNPEDYRTYQEIKAHILADHREKPLFPVYDRPSQLYEWVASLRFRPLKRLLYQGILEVRRNRRKRLLASLEAINRSGTP
jgi:glycosyltransferase involved in cell wall biosynthesis